MGCGASVKTTSSGKIEAKEDEPPDTVTTWATRLEARRPLNSTTADPRAVGSKGGWPTDGGPWNVTVMDAEDESTIEIIDEGKTTMTPIEIQAVNCANGQEAPEIAEVVEEEEGKPIRQNTEHALSKRQKEEAAKLAERRKRFDNQRYLAAAGVADPQATSPGAGVAAEVRATTAATIPATAAATAVPNEQPKHDLVLGLNLTETPYDQDVIINSDCLPGGIAGDTPRVDVLPQTMVRNNHDYFDDDDELLMKEILDSVEV